VKLPIALTVSAIVCVGAANAQPQPYSGQEAREIKAVSGEQVQQYLDGAGMGYAKAAELNHYPGPAHALELADKLGLTPEQIAATRALMTSHRAEAREIGKRLIETEQALDALFRDGQADKVELAKAVRQAAQVEGEYRLSHLETHRRLRALLTAEQVSVYDKLRGYSASSPHSGHSH